MRKEQLVEQVGLTSDLGKGWKGYWKEPWYLQVVSFTEGISSGILIAFMMSSYLPNDSHLLEPSLDDLGPSREKVTLTLGVALASLSALSRQLTVTESA